MIEQRKFVLEKTPYIRKADFEQNTSRIMFDFLISLLPLILFAWYKNGILPYVNEDIGFLQMLYPLLFIVIGGLSAFIVEGLYYVLFLKEQNVFEKLKYSFPVIPGVLLAMILPLNTPIWVLIIGVVFGVIVGKMLFGGFGYNIFNPALIGYAFLSVAFYGIMTRVDGGFLNGSEIVTGATPLTNFFSNFPDGKITMDQAIAPYGSLLNFFLGTIPGSIAETSSILCLFSLVYLLMRKVINWRIPVIYLLTVLVFSIFFGVHLGYTQALEVGNYIVNVIDYRFILFNMFSGGLMFGAVFMATEPVTKPRTPNGEVVYAVFLAALTMMVRFLVTPEGVASSILFMNFFTPLIDQKFAKVRVADKKAVKIISLKEQGFFKFLGNVFVALWYKIKPVFAYILVGLGVLAIFAFTIASI